MRSISRSIVFSLIALSVAIGTASTAIASVVIFSDSFNRGNSSRIRAPAAYPLERWGESGRSRIRGQRLLLERNASASQHFSTEGYENITLSFLFRPLPRSDRADELIVSLYGGGGRIDEVSLGLPGSRTYDLPEAADDNPAFGFLFRTRVSRGEGVYIDRVIVRGDPIITAAVPESSTWAMMMLGFAGVGYMTYRRRGQSATVAA